MTTAATTPYREHPVVFRAGKEDLYGILVEPHASRDGVAVVLSTGGGRIPMTHRNRMWTRLARRIAVDGVPVLRFDWHGAGESTGRVREFHSDYPFVDDLVAAVRCLEAHRQVSHLILVGTCLGARAILSAGEHLPQMSGAVLLSTPLRGRRLEEAAANNFADTLTVGGYLRWAARSRVMKRLLDPSWRLRYWRIAKVKMERIASVPPLWGRRRAELGSPAWLSRKFLDPVRSLPQRGVRLLMLYGSDDEYYPDFKQALQYELGEIVRTAGDRLEVEVISGTLHGFTTLEMQQAAIARTCEWIRAASQRLGQHGAA